MPWKSLICFFSRLVQFFADIGKIGGQMLDMIDIDYQSLFESYTVNKRNNIEIKEASVPSSDCPPE